MDLSCLVLLFSTTITWPRKALVVAWIWEVYKISFAGFMTSVEFNRENNEGAKDKSERIIHSFGCC